jgi:hypothetical protein
MRSHMSIHCSQRVIQQIHCFILRGERGKLCSALEHAHPPFGIKYMHWSSTYTWYTMCKWNQLDGGGVYPSVLLIIMIAT